MSLREYWNNWLQHRDDAFVHGEIVHTLVHVSPFDVDDLHFALERGIDFNAVQDGGLTKAPLWMLMLPRRFDVIDDVDDRSAAALTMLEIVENIDFAARTDKGDSALHVLDKGASLALFTALVSRGCDVHAVDRHQRPLLFAWLSRPDIVRVLLAAGVAIDGYDRPVMHRLLDMQGKGGDVVGVAELLLAAGASLAPWMDAGRQVEGSPPETLVQRALRSANPELVPWLLAHGVDATVQERLRFAAKRFESRADGDELLAILADALAVDDEAANIQLYWQLKVLAHARNNERIEAVAAGEESLRRFGVHDVIFDALLPNWLRVPGKLELAWSTWQELQQRFDPKGEAAANIIAHLVVLHVETKQLRAGRSLLAYADDARGTKESRPGLMDFNLACLCALTHDVDGTVHHSTHALGKDYTAKDFNDADFDAVRDEPAFAELLAEHARKRRRHED
jgi:hypothetical protein